MIYTITLNPAIDYYIETKKTFIVGETMRSCSEAISYGGKGINVSKVLTNLSVPNIAIGFVAGATGKLFENGINSIGVTTKMFEVSKGLTRINIKLKSSANEEFNSPIETEINGSGPILNNNDIETLINYLNEVLQSGDVIIFAGNNAQGTNSKIYADICAKLTQRNNIKIVVDAEKRLLHNTLKYHPYLIKPNQKELSDITGINIKSKEDTIKGAKFLKDLGAQNVLVSLDKNGAILLNGENKIFSCTPDKTNGKFISSNGAGDTLLALFIYAKLIKNMNAMEALKYSVNLASKKCYDEVKI